MAGDQFNWDILVRLAVKGGPEAKKAIEDLARSTNNSEKAADGLSKALVKAERGLSKQSKSTVEAVSTSKALESAQQSLNQALDKQGSERATRGLDSVQAAQVRLTRATADRQRAEQQLASGVGGQAQVDATRRVTEAVKQQTSAQGALNRANESSTASTISLRYANYDLATSMLSLSAGITAAGVGLVSAFASQESAFTSVERTADGALGNIRQSLMDLSTQIPVSFNELAEIATLGNQLGIGADQLEAFTTTVAQFSAVTGITAEQSALAFGKLGNLLGVSASDYDRLASSIALVGRTTAATEAQIVSVASEIAPAAAAAGFTADQVIGLSGALASLKVPPERSRSTILQFFETLNMAVAEGGDKLDNFAAVVGVSASELESMVRSGQGQGILDRFIGNVSSSDTIEITQALEALGLAGLRTNPTIRALAGNTKLLNQAFRDGEKGYTENIELQRQMAFILDDLSTKWQTFLNAAMNASAAIGSAVAPAIGQLLDILKNLVIGLGEFASSEFGQMFFRMVGTILTVVAAYATLRGGIALATASLQAFSLISTALNGAGIVAGLRGLASTFGLVTGAASTAATVTGHTLPAAFGTATAASGRFASAMRIAGGALLALGKATVILGLFQLAISLVTDFGGTMQWFAGIMTGVASTVGGAIRGIINFVADMVNNLGAAIPAIARIVDYLRAAANLAPAVFDQTSVKPFRDWANSLATASDELGGLGDTAAGIPFDEYASDTGGWGDELDDMGDSAAGAADKVRTLVDYGNDLQSVFSRAFDIRFAGGSTLDAITSTFQSIREATEESARNIQKLKAEIQGLQSDLSIQQYFLGIAIEYGDTARAEAIQANMAKIQADLAAKTADLSNEQAANSKELTGNSKAALANRKQMEELVGQYQAHLVALASSGLSQEELSRRTAELREQFIQQATQLGYSRAEIDKYAQAFDDMRLIIDRLPRNITLSVNANPAIQALAEYEAAIDRARANAGRGLALGAITNPTNGKEVRRAAFEADLAAAIARIKELIAAGQVSGAEAIVINNRIRDLAQRLANGNYASGGYTGAGGKYEPAGIVHRGEYVVPKKDVNQRTGLPYADAMGKLQRGASGPGYAGGGYVRPSAGNVSAQMALSAMGVQQFQQIMGAALRVYLDGRAIANNTANQFANQTANGAY